MVCCISLAFSFSTTTATSLLYHLLLTFLFLPSRYDERIDRVETRIAAKLRDQLGTAKNANEMFRIFSRYNALFVRAHIRGAIREYQTQLIQRVKDDIEKLHLKFKVCVCVGCGCGCEGGCACVHAGKWVVGDPG